MTNDVFRDAHALYQAAREYVKAWAKVGAPHVPQDKIDSIVDAVGEVGIAPACEALANLEIERAGKKK